eukprot:TRINITY_DN1096_c0_g2_i5.p1 TRINITY_DN1096_c0_g2~~TRINITY_DN1096_c0_g2_i5.p1  ORF type:complete len:478 (-),score=59.37 TRINITY_DN1096_c0_g2_i5:66-1499(-)
MRGTVMHNKRLAHLYCRFSKNLYKDVLFLSPSLTSDSPISKTPSVFATPSIRPVTPSKFTVSHFTEDPPLLSSLAYKGLHVSLEIHRRVGGVRSHVGHSHGGDDLQELGSAFGKSGSSERKSEDPRGQKAVDRILRVGLVADVVLTAGKGAAGIASGSTALVADAAHSVSDIVLSGVSLWSVRAARAPSTPAFPYGYGKLETLAALGVGALLAGTGGGIAWHAVEVLQGLLTTDSSLSLGEMVAKLAWGEGAEGAVSHGSGGHHHHAIDMELGEVALTVAVFSILTKESLYQVSKALGERYGSQLLKATAWHHRGDAVSTLVALVGIGGSMLGLPLLDPVAALFVAVFILRAASSIAMQSIRELLDAGLSEALLDPIRKTALAVPGVKSLPFLRGRKMGSSVHVDMAIGVDPALSVHAAHEVAEAVRREIRATFPLVIGILIRIGGAGTSTLHSSVILPRAFCVRISKHFLACVRSP